MARPPLVDYERSATRHARRFESVSFEQVHGPIIDLLPTPPATILDIGAGSGRDAAALARRGLSVVAVEPSPDLRKIGQRLHSGSDITWVDDQLPELGQLRAAQKFDLVLLSAVWMHINPAHRAASFRRLTQLLKAAARLIISLRLARQDRNRRIYTVTVNEVERLARANGLQVLRLATSKDELGRAGVGWIHVVLENH